MNYLLNSENWNECVTKTHKISSRSVCVCVCVCVCVPCCKLDAAFFTLDAGLLARSQYSEGSATGHIDTGFFLVFLCLKANAETVPKIPSCH